MPGSPFRERRLSPEEVQRVVRRAAELVPGEALTAAELERRLAELGVPAEAMKQAMDLPGAAAVEAPDGAVRIDAAIEIDGAVPADRFEDVADAISEVMKMQGQVSAVGNKLTWTPGGVVREPAVTVQVKDGRTRIRLVETLGNPADARGGFWVLSGFGGMSVCLVATAAGVGIAKAVEVSAAQGAPAVLAVAGLLGIASAVGAYLGLRRSLARRIAVRTRQAPDTLSRLEMAVRRSIPVRTRVEPASEPEGESEIERELELEPEREPVRAPRKA